MPMRWLTYDKKLLAALIMVLLFLGMVMSAWFYSVYNLYTIYQRQDACISKPLESPAFTVSHLGKDTYMVTEVKTGRMFIATGTD